MTIKRYCAYCGSPLKSLKGKPGHLVCPNCHAKFYKNPLPAVAALILRNEQLLLVKRAVPPFEGSWCLPGGFVESGEDVQEALFRELLEETGLKGGDAHLVDVVSYVDENPEGTGVIIIGYRVGEVKGAPVPGDDAREVRFFPVAELPPIPFSSHRALIDRVRGKK